MEKYISIIVIAVISEWMKKHEHSQYMGVFSLREFGKIRVTTRTSPGKEEEEYHLRIY